MITSPSTISKAFISEDSNIPGLFILALDLPIDNTNNSCQPHEFKLMHRTYLADDGKTLVNRHFLFPLSVESLHVLRKALNDHFSF